MATIIPSHISDLNDPTPGEKRVYELLRRFPDTCYVWYEVVIGERDYRPDFVVLDPYRGIWIVEVKDWSVDVIKSASPKRFVIQHKGNHQVERANPARKCETYIRNVKESLQLEDTLCDERGLLKVPVEYAVVFPNMTSEEFMHEGYNQVIDEKRVICKDQLPELQTVMETSLTRIHSPLDRFQLSRIKRILRPETTVEIEAHQNGHIINTGKVSVEDFDREFAVDVEQENIAKSLGEGPRLLRGLAGSGKTLILLMRAKLMVSNADMMGTPKRVLILCWNISLANYLRQAFRKVHIPFEGEVYDTIKARGAKSSVEIMHFVGWARAMLPARVTLETNAPNFLDQIIEGLNQRTIREHEKYDAIFIDEAQDFRAEWIGFLFHHAIRGDDPKNRDLIISADDAQRIYRHQGDRSFSWAQLGIPIQGRSRVMRRVYRNSARVWMYAGLMLGKIGDYYQEEDGRPNSSIWFAPKKGIDPQLVQCKNFQSQIDEVISTINDIKEQGYALRNVLILYARKSVQDLSKPNRSFRLIDRLLEQLDRFRVPYDWITEDSESKARFDWSKESVKISTVHSAKGLDAPVVIILGAEGFADGLHDAEKLMYVAMTRAREYLKIIYTSQTPIIEQLEKAMEMYVQRHHHIRQIEEKCAGNFYI
jgi:hypothetical protein